MALQAVNTYVPFCSEDQATVLSVIEDHLTSPCGESDSIVRRSCTG